jgi:hypothetical protein
LPSALAPYPETPPAEALPGMPPSQSTLEYAVGSVVLGLGALILSSGAAAPFIGGSVALVIWWLSLTGLGAFGVLLGILGLRSHGGPRPGFWGNLVGIVLNGVALLFGMILFFMLLSERSQLHPRF